MQKLQLFTSVDGKSLQPALGQACDQCRRRKTRCNRAHPCVHCLKTGQTCSYDQAPKTRGRRPKRRPVVENESSTQAEDPESTAWTDTLPDLTCYMPPVLGTMDDLQLPLTPASGFDWQTPSLTSTDTVCNETVKTPLARQENWCDTPQGSPQLLGRRYFIPYVQLFFERLYPIFPVLSKEPLMAILEAPQLQDQALPPSLYTFLTALSAAVIVQLNISHDEPSLATDPPDSQSWDLLSPRLTGLSPDVFIAQCLEARRNHEFIEDADEWTILTSFFLFEHYGNCNQSKFAWYYLREAIGFAQSLGLDDPDTYIGLDTDTSQRRRVLFWLLFVTERAYAIQCRTRVILRQSIDLPHVFESNEPKLMYGFVTLARVFSLVDSAFIAAWRTQNAPSPLSAGDARRALTKLLNEEVQIDAVAAGEMNETQRLDILITQQWLKTLAWQLQSNLESSQGAHQLQGIKAMVLPKRDSTSVVKASKSLLDVVFTANGPSLEAHGIGMEQKVSDVAHCLCDVLEPREDDDMALEFFSTQDFLHQFMVFLADFRRRESQYLQPLLQRASGCLSRCIQPSRPLLDGKEGESWETGDGFLEGLDQVC